MEFCWFAICAILAFIPWISAEEKLLYQTPNENRWGSWDVITDGLSSLNVIKLVFCCFTQYPDYKHLICRRAAFLWWSCRVHHSWPSLALKGHHRKSGTSLKVQQTLKWCFLPFMPVLFYTRLFSELLICMCWAPYFFCLSVSDWLFVP